MTLTFVPLVVLALWKGGWWIALIPFYGWALMPALDLLLGRNLRNPDPATPDEDSFWFRLLTWIWLPVQLCLVYGAIRCPEHLGDYSTLETLGIMFGIGVTTGTVSIVYAHKLFHKPGWTERYLGDLLMALVLYGHFRTEHLLVHHPWVGTSRDTVTARYNESFYRAFGLTMLAGFGSAWRAERALLARRGLGPWRSKSCASSIMVFSPLIAATATFALKAGPWFRRGRLAMVFSSLAASCCCYAENPLIPAVQISAAASRSR